MYKKYQLKNGLTVLHVESHKSPVVSIQMWVRTGSADEKKGEEGLSHFIEHLVFKGTKKFGVGEIASIIEGSGGQLNAYTSFDQTVFYVTISKSFVDTGLEAISEMMGFPSFDEVEIDNEREVVIEEIKRGMDNPHRQASRQLFSTVYKKHPYRLPVIGFAENIRKVSREKILSYYHSRYVPDNMTLLVVGDIESKEIKAKVKAYFGGFEPYKLKKVKREREPKQNTPRTTIKKAEFQESLMYLSWPLPSAKHKDIPAIDVLTLILGQGDSSRLSRRIKLEKGLVNYIGSSSFTPQDDGFLAISASTSPQKVEAVFAGVNEVLREFVENPPTDEEMKKALINFNSEEYYSMETVDGMASKVGTYEHLFRDYRHFREFMKEVNNLTVKDLVRVAKKYMKPEKLSVVVMTPEAEAEAKTAAGKFRKDYKKTYEKLHSLKKVEPGKAKYKKLRWSTSSKKEIADRIEKVILSGGAEAYLRPNFETKVLSLKAAFRGGVRTEPEGLLGLTDLLSRCWGRSTKDYNEHELNDKIDSLATSLSSFAGRNTVGLSMTSLNPLSNDAFELFANMATEPVFEASVVEREKQMMLEFLKMRQDNPAQLAIQKFMSRIFEGHPYAKDLHGTPESIAKLTGKQLGTLLGQSIGTKNMKLVLAGCFDPDEWKENLNNFAKSLPEGKAVTNTFEVIGHKEPVFEYISSKKEQSHIVVGYPGLTFTSEDRYALQLMQSVLAGQGGRLFLELRDKESLAYSVSPLRMEGIDAGYFGAYIGCSPEKGQKAIGMMKTEFQKLMDSKVSEHELQRARRYLIGRHDIDLQKTSSVSSAILFDTIYGLDANEPFDYADRVNSVHAEDLEVIAQKIFSQPAVSVCVGPEKPW